MAPLSKPQREAIRKAIACAQANLGTFRLYWLPSHGRVAARSVSVTRHFRVPEEAVHVGIYAAGISASEIVRDVLEVIERLPEPV